MKRLFVTILLVCLAMSAKAQEGEIKPHDALATWTDLIYRKDIGKKWHVGGFVEYCTIDRFDGKGMVNDEVILRPIVGYNPLDWLRFQMQMDFLYSFSGGFYLRYLPDVTLHWKAGDFRFAFRNRLQLSHKVSTGQLSPVMRSRLKVDYIVPDSPVSLHIAAEPYWLKSITKARYLAGVDWQVHKSLCITADYIRYANYSPTSPHSNVISLALYVRM